MQTAPPEFSGAAVNEVLRESYAINGSLSRQDSERDLNYHVRSDDGREYVFKIANRAEVPGVTDFQIAALLHLEQAAPELPVPRVISTARGQTSITVADDQGRPHTVRLLSWLDGIPLREARFGPRMIRQLGDLLARLGQALQGFEHPASDYPLLWDIRQATHLDSQLGMIPDPDLRTLCSQRLTDFADRLQPALSRCRWQVIHNDLNRGNVLVNPDGGEISGIIDFGDIVKSALVIDVAVAAAYLCKKGDEALDDVLEFLRGYHVVNPLEDSELDLLPDLICMRNVETIVIAHWRASCHPENSEYILRSIDNAEQMLTELSAREPGEVAALFRGACMDTVA